MGPYKGKKIMKAYKKKAKPRTKSLTVKDVKAIVRQDQENKRVYSSRDGVGAPFNGAISQVDDLMFVLPNMPQNVSESGRIANQVKAINLRIQGIMTMNLSYSGDYSNTRLGVRVFIVQPKLYTNRDVINTEWASWTSNLLRKGQVNTGFTGVVSDLYADVNSEFITTYYDKVFYLSTSYAGNVSTGGIETAFSHKPLDINLKLRNKILKYDTGYYGNLAPTNYCPVMLLGYVHLDGSGADTVQTQVNMSYISELTYDDN